MAQRTSKSVVGYTKENPVTALAIAAASGAVLYIAFRTPRRNRAFSIMYILDNVGNDTIGVGQHPRQQSRPRTHLATYRRHFERHCLGIVMFNHPGDP